MTENTTKRPIESALDEASKKPKLDQRERALKVVQESQVGITSYINENNRSDGGFIGSIKQLYADFQVNEIDMDGKVVHLEDEGLDLGKSKKERRAEKREQEKAETEDMSPEELEAYKEKKRVEEEAKKAEEEAKPKYTLSDEDRKELLTLISENELAQVEQLYTTGNNMQTTTVFNDKQVRGKLHQLFRSAFQGTLDTITSPENHFNIALAKKGQGRHKTNPQESMHHVDENGVVNYGLGPFKPYLHFTVYKENRETMEVASTISKLLRFPPKAINFAGTKDRRGVTCQRFSIHRGKVVRVSSLNKALKGSTLGGFSYEDRPLGLGDLKGNEFVITIRDLQAVRSEDNVEQVVAECFDSLKEKGFINYYGMQRFGSFSISTHVLGVHVLKEDWKSVVELILSEQEVVAPDSVEARRIWAETSNPTLTLKKMPHRFSAESSILKVLEKEQLNEDEEYGSNSYFKAIMAIPKNLRIMYGHAYQSYVWNMVATKRIELFGLELQVGDLVVDDTPAVKDEDFEEDVAISRDTKVKPLTQEDIDSGKYSIYDVVLPGPGYKIQYPTNETLRQVYVDTMAKDGLDPFKMSRRVKEFSLAGSYRNLMSKPEHLSYELVRYSGDEVPLVRTDMEILKQKKEGVEAPGRIINTSPDGEKLAIVLSMQLGVSSYATMALREFMKADTARFSQAMMAPAN
ncbi:tRNA pseudouridine synthase D [Suhomyces tanzawaensis NRRL Y-17324]|uniref:tRNA pseudouridine synthase D n=1 Tax=Suhomyces tanzawaensis NRRL Y-17324 TaxID=984487 RepID=A0A1E4SSE8_9ASCO|nr:tRNA pseudouridine synthase D [Suhomyces tanzawaensis NRRL Y-17324]ODV82438.1 tRNA pseudouridine synthase D [Suhomyces tanzawaensis NRRL Y-17324]